MARPSPATCASCASQAESAASASTSALPHQHPARGRTRLPPGPPPPSRPLLPCPTLAPSSLRSFLLPPQHVPKPTKTPISTPPSSPLLCRTTATSTVAPSFTPAPPPVSSAPAKSFFYPCLATDPASTATHPSTHSPPGLLSLTSLSSSPSSSPSTPSPHPFSRYSVPFYLVITPIMRSTRFSKADAPVSPPNTRSRARARNDGGVPAVTGKRRRVDDTDDDEANGADDNVVDSKSDDDNRYIARDRSSSRSRSRSLSVIPTSDMPPLTLPAPDDAAVRALGLTQSAKPGAQPVTLEYEHLVRMREGHFYRPRPTTPPERERNWNELSISEAAWIRLEEAGVINKGRSWTSRIGLDENGDREYTVHTRPLIPHCHPFLASRTSRSRVIQPGTSCLGTAVHSLLRCSSVCPAAECQIWSRLVNWPPTMLSPRDGCARTGSRPGTAPWGRRASWGPRPALWMLTDAWRAGRCAPWGVNGWTRCGLGGVAAGRGDWPRKWTERALRSSLGSVWGVKEVSVNGSPVARRGA